MKIDENLASIHAYLCADGYVVRNPPTQKHLYYRIGLRNTNLVLLKDFQDKFENYFKVKPRLVEGQRCEKGSRQIYEILTKEFGSFYSWEWKIPRLENNLLRLWLRAYFDCEGWVTCKHHQNRHIGADCVNKTGIYQVKDALERLGISSQIKKRNTRDIYTLHIYGKENFIKFKNKVGFLHPKKSERLDNVLADFMVYEWDFPKEKDKLMLFIKEVMNQKAKVHQNNRIVRVMSNKEVNLLKLQELLTDIFNIESKVHKRKNGLGTVYYELNINKREEVRKLINLHLLSGLEERKWLK